jgi:hypothetical protein
MYVYYSYVSESECRGVNPTNNEKARGVFMFFSQIHFLQLESFLPSLLTLRPLVEERS